MKGNLQMMPGMPDLTQIVLKAQQMQAEMERAQASLAHTEVTGSAGGGLVTAVLDGAGELRSINIDPSVVDPADVETLEDLVVAAVHDARRAAEALATSTMGTVAGGLAGSLDLSSLGLPGLNFPGFGPVPDDGADEDADDDGEDDEYLDDEDEGEYPDEDPDEGIIDSGVDVGAPRDLPGQLPPGGLPSGGLPSGRGEA